MTTKKWWKKKKHHRTSANRINDRINKKNKTRQAGGNSNKFEKVPMRRDSAKELPALPAVNQENYPQENPAFLARENSARNDKYTLRMLCLGFTEDDLPEIVTLFN